VWDADHEREIVLLTNLLEFGATTIAAIYKERWKIELFFKGTEPEPDREDLRRHQ
jgi:IS4 transposase